MNCLSCGKSSHSFDKCPLIHYIADKDFLIKKHLHDELQQRNPNFSRKKQKKFNALKNYDLVQSEICHMNSELFSIDDFLEFPEAEFDNYIMKNSDVMEEMKENEKSPRIYGLENTNFSESQKILDPSPKSQVNFKNFQLIAGNKTSDEIRNVEKPIVREKSNEFLDKDKTIQSFRNFQKTGKSKKLERNEEKFIENENNDDFPNLKLFDYEFEILKNYNLYFIEGNAQKIVNKMRMHDVDKIKTVVLSPKLQKRARERFSISKAMKKIEKISILS